MTAQSFKWFAMVFGVLPFLVYAFSLRSKVRTVDSYYLASKDLSKRGLFSTLAATWLLLGNVVVAAMILGGFYGVLNWWMIITWVLGFYFISRHATAIKSALDRREKTTLHSYLSERFNSVYLRKFAATVTFFVSIGIISLELIIGMALFVSFSEPDNFAPLLAGVVLAVTITLYCSMGGLTAVVRSDKFQLGGIIISLGVIAGIAVLILMDPSKRDLVPASSYDLSWSNHASIGWPYYVGLLFLQVPLLTGDFGTWQRIKACKTEVPGPEIRKAFKGVGLLNLFLWAILVFAGVAVATIGLEEVGQSLSSSQFYSSAEPLIDLLVAAKIYTSETIGNILIFSIVIGMLWALMSSADSYLLIAQQTWTTDVFDKSSAEIQSNPNESVDRGRKLSSVIMLISLLVALAAVCREAPLVSLVFIIFGSQTALAPLALYAIRDDIEPSSSGSVPIVMAFLGFVGGILFGVWATFISNDSFYINNGAYLTPLIAFVTPMLGLVFVDLKRNGLKGLGTLIRHFVGT